MTAPAGLGDGRDDRERGPGVEEVSPEATMFQFAGHIVNRLFSVGLSLESARSIIGEGPAGDRVAAATDEVDHMIRDIRTTMLGLAADRENSRSRQRSPLPGGQQPLAGLPDRMAPLQRRMAQTARALQAAAADAVALLGRQADTVGPPGRIDYPTEIKRWQAFADQAGQTAERWEEQP